MKAMSAGSQPPSSSPQAVTIIAMATILQLKLSLMDEVWIHDLKHATPCFRNREKRQKKSEIEK